MSAPRFDETAAPPLRPAAPASHLSVLAVVVASLSSVAAALVGRQVWGPGTLVGAAATPVVVMVVAEVLQRPARRLALPANPHFATPPPRYDPVASGRAGIAAGALRGPMPEAGAVHFRRRRSRLAVAFLTGLACFVIGAASLTGYELVVKRSSVGSPSDKTTLFTSSPRAKRTAPVTLEPRSTTPGTSSTTPAPAAPATTSSTPTGTSGPATPSTPTATSVPATPSAPVLPPAAPPPSTAP